MKFSKWYSMHSKHFVFLLLVRGSHCSMLRVPFFRTQCIYCTCICGVFILLNFYVIFVSGTCLCVTTLSFSFRSFRRCSSFSGQSSKNSNRPGSPQQSESGSAGQCPPPERHRRPEQSNSTSASETRKLRQLQQQPEQFPGKQFRCHFASAAQAPSLSPRRHLLPVGAAHQGPRRPGGLRSSRCTPHRTPDRCAAERPSLLAGSQKRGGHRPSKSRRRRGRYQGLRFWVSQQEPDGQAELVQELSLRAGNRE